MATKEKYFVIYCSEDGDHWLHIMDEQEYRRQIKEEDINPKNFLSESEINNNYNLSYHTGIFVIKGRVVNK